MAYHSAYRGIATGANGEFDHFVRTIDPSHLEGGYWRFQTIDDDRRAMARGFTTPEDVLQAADSSDDRFDEIILRWVRGANDTSFKMAMSGTAHHHLQTIYELRSMLHLPMSSRGQVPLYPISTNPRLKQYWEAKYRAQRPTPIDPAIQLPERPISSPVTPGPVHSTSSQAQHAEPATPKSPIGRVTRARSAKLSQAAGPKPAAKTKSVKQRTSATTLPAGQLSPTSSSLEKVKISLPPSKAKSQQQAPSQRFETQPLIPAQPGNDRRDGRNAGSSANKGHKPIAAPTTPSAFDDDDSIPGVSISPHAPHNASSKTPTMGSQEVSSEDRYSPLQLPASSPAHHTEGTNIEEPIAAVGSCNTATNGQAYASRGRQQPSISDLRSLSTSDVSTLGTKAVAVAEKPVETISEPWGSYMKGLEQLPCVDCGEDEGHQLDCNLGSITPMQNLTVLDYRTLADAVEQFDPGPWTTHFVPPEPEPEDAATQMRGMAAVIRNEDSYKQDAELHGLPDDLMMMLWAFKTSDNVQVINEEDWDSGIGEFEMW
ncbi:uncharacterized protein J4E79_008647 [Alternaria viburni]|uniref:uncharacterized protein n=1 Tax=Alternaria viburni TaxID=566460 RepID=UPI0020C33CB4|nr:uncharacterized protein J4E79_008647 [Alternaria viburni]KAI4653134.1 hypothetical protein J4E79_008647 [Alternaria viburni]